MNLAASHIANHWGDDAPDWVVKLAEACDSSNQKAVADQIGYSPTAVSQVLKNCYPSDLKGIETAIKGALMNKFVVCNVAGEISAARCMEIQRRPFAPTNSQRVKLYRACRGGCQHYKGGTQQ